MWGAYTEGLGKFGKHVYIPSITALVKKHLLKTIASCLCVTYS